MKGLGIAIIIIGLGLTFFTLIPLVTEKKVIEIGNLEINKKTSHKATWPPFLGIAVTLIGATILLKSNHK